MIRQTRVLSTKTGNDTNLANVNKQFYQSKFREPYVCFKEYERATNICGFLFQALFANATEKSDSQLSTVDNIVWRATS